MSRIYADLVKAGRKTFAEIPEKLKPGVKEILKAELTNEGTIKFRLFSIYVFFMKYVSPIAIGIVFLNELGLLDQLKKLF